MALAAARPTYTRQDGDVRWRLYESAERHPVADEKLRRYVVARGETLIVTNYAGVILESGAPADILRRFAVERHDAIIRTFERKRAEWLSYNDDVTRAGGRVAYERMYPDRSGWPRDPADFPFEARLNELRATSPEVPSTVQAAADAWKWQLVA